jgi:transposase
MARKGYSAEFRRRALDLVAAAKPVRQVARLLEVSDQPICIWRRQELIDRGELPGLSSEERDELRETRRRMKELWTEPTVHRRAAELLRESVRPKGASRRFRKDRLAATASALLKHGARKRSRAGWWPSRSDRLVSRGVCRITG